MGCSGSFRRFGVFLVVRVLRVFRYLGRGVRQECAWLKEGALSIGIESMGFSIV